MTADWNRITPEPEQTRAPERPVAAERAQVAQAPPIVRLNAVPLLVLSVVFAVALLAILFYWNQQDKDLRKELATHNELITKRLDDADSKLAKLESQITVTQERVGVTQRDLDRARSLAVRLKAEQQTNVKKLTEELSQKASAQDVSSLKEATSAQIGSVSQNVGSVKTEVGTVREELKGTREDLDRTKKDLTNLNLVLDQHGKLIATNAQGLETLRMKGEREYFEFDITKKDKIKRVSDIRLELRDTDSKKQRADIRIHINDARVDKNRVYVNEPIHVRQGREGLDYEVVINQVMKNQIRGYLSVPKNRSLAVSGPRT
ncbi:MAG TPA: hypothetical protein VGK99_05645 [Acidobacteriota bacterium]|jgi:chromosome segregation ATPase